MGQIFRSRTFYRAAGVIFLIKLLWLLLACPLYDLDTNSFIRGGFSWDIYHNPFMNLFIAGLGKIWSNAWFIVSVQCLGFAFCGAFLLEAWFGGARQRTPYWIALAVIALEPLTTFYNFSLLPESFFTGFTFLAIGSAILWLRQPSLRTAPFFGLAMGLTFLCKLSAMIHLPLFAVFLLRMPGQGAFFQRFLRGPVRHGFAALAPFVVCYAFVYIGQKTINEGDLYTVEGRVRWDFSSALYRADEIDAPDFKRLVHPYILPGGELVAHRELRRELSYLGYKDCVAEYESRGMSHNRGVNACDSIFGAVAGQIMDRHFWASEKQFVKDNFRFVHELSYIDYRFTPGLYYYHPQAEWDYLDSLMRTHYQFDLSQNQDRIPGIWTSLSFGNTYMPILWWLAWVAILTGLIFWFRDRKAKDLLTTALFLAIPMVFHLVYISYRPRFLAPYVILILLLTLQIALRPGRGKSPTSV